MQGEKVSSVNFTMSIFPVMQSSHLCPNIVFSDFGNRGSFYVEVSHSSFFQLPYDIQQACHVAFIFVHEYAYHPYIRLCYSMYNFGLVYKFFFQKTIIQNTAIQKSTITVSFWGIPGVVMFNVIKEATIIVYNGVSTENLMVFS